MRNLGGFRVSPMRCRCSRRFLGSPRRVMNWLLGFKKRGSGDVWRGYVDLYKGLGFFKGGP